MCLYVSTMERETRAADTQVRRCLLRWRLARTAWLQGKSDPAERWSPSHIFFMTTPLSTAVSSPVSRRDMKLRHHGDVTAHTSYGSRLSLGLPAQPRGPARRSRHTRLEAGWEASRDGPIPEKEPLPCPPLCDALAARADAVSRRLFCALKTHDIHEPSPRVLYRSLTLHTHKRTKGEPAGASRASPTHSALFLLDSKESFFYDSHRLFLTKRTPRRPSPTILSSLPRTQLHPPALAPERC
jgi:hypothetical protein